MSVTKKWGHFDASGGFISNGIARINHNIKHDRYSVFTQKLYHADDITVTGVFSTYFTVEVRRNGVLISSDFEFNIVGDNYP